MASSGNFCTFNPAYRGTTTLYDHVLSAGNTIITQSNISGSNHSCGTAGTHLFASGKFYWEAYMPANQVGSSHAAAGILNAGDGATKSSSSIGLGISTGDIGINPADLVVKFSNTQTKDYSESAFSSGDILQIAVDADNGAIYFGKNNTFLGSSDPTSGSSKTNAGATWTPSSYAGGWVPSAGTQGGNGNALYMNWGQDSTFAGARSAGGNADENGFGDFVYSPPSGYLALCSANLPISDDIDPAQTDDDFPGKQFNVVTYTGNGSTQSINVGLQPDFLWFKNRGTANSWVMFDSTRGTTKTFNSDKTNAEQTGAYTNLDAFTSTGFDLDGGGTGDVNQSSANLIAYCWRANGGTTASNSDGSITSTVQANTAAGFSIITYTGDENAGTIGHGLSAKPDLVFFKSRDTSDDWGVYHSAIGATNALTGLSSSAGLYNYTIFNNTEPTTSVITLGAAGSVGRYRNNKASTDYIAYCWHGVDGYSKFGKFEGNANNEGPYIYTGFRPRLLFIKNIDSSSPWGVYDTERPGFNDCDLAAWDEGTAPDNNIGAYPLDILSNGFKLRTSNSTVNSSHTWVYGAWGDVPFKYNNTF